MTDQTSDAGQPNAAQQQRAAMHPDAQAEADAYQVDVWKRQDAAKDSTVPVTLREQLLWAKELAQADLLPVAYRDKPANVLLAMQTARELGLPYMAALRLLNVVEGQPRLGGEGVRAAILAAGHQCWTDDPEYNAHGIPLSVTAHGVRKDSGQEFHATFTLEQAARAGLCTLERDEAGAVTEVRAYSNNGKALPWMQYTEDMLDHRSMTRLARRGFPDVTGGLARETDDDSDPTATGKQAPSAPAPAPTVPGGLVVAPSPAEPTADVGPELRRTDLPDPYNPADDLAMAGEQWWLHAGSSVRRRSAAQLAADRLLRAAAEGLDETIPLPHPFADKVPTDWPPVTAAYIVRAMAQRGHNADGSPADLEGEVVEEPTGPRPMAGTVDAVRAEGRDPADPESYPLTRVPYAGVGAEGCRASAQIDREEADTLDVGASRRTELLASAEAWLIQAKLTEDQEAADAAEQGDDGALAAVPDAEPAELPVEDPPAVADPFTLPIADAPATADAPAAGPTRAELMGRVEALAAERGKTVQQLLARVVIAERCDVADLPDAALVGFLQAQEGVR